MLMDIKVLPWKLEFKILITRETPWCIIKLLCVSSLTKISDETVLHSDVDKWIPNSEQSDFKETQFLSGCGALVSRTGAKDLALWGRGLRSQRSQSSFTAHSSMRSTTDLCDKDGSFQFRHPEPQAFDGQSGQEQYWRIHQHINCSFVCKCVLAFGK